MNEIVFLGKKALEGRYTAHALSESIFIQAHSVHPERSLEGKVEGQTKGPALFLGHSLQTQKHLRNADASGRDAQPRPDLAMPSRTSAECVVQYNPAKVPK